ncbi:MAG: GNAT family N-acetyltransferase [Saprospirales bacterium]|nr:MAG: GNAT family N-acetyltransferase [Saprospirales bacterium]
MVKIIKRKKLDIKAYDNAVLGSGVNTLYAESWYLDTLLGSFWAAIVFEDYQLVMPIPYSRNYRFFFQKKVMQPLFCQQLGIFGDLNKLPKSQKKLLELFQSSRPYTYQFNSSNRPFLEESQLTFKERKNYILPLNADYEQLKKGYSTNLIRNLKKADKHNLKFITATDEETWFTFLEIKMNQLRLNRQKRWTQRMGRLMKAAMNMGKGYFAVTKKDDEVLSMAFMMVNEKRLVYLFAVKTQEGGKMGANHFLIDQIIREGASQNKVLDFEGSDVEGVERFFKSFGAINEPYFSLEK